jgi:hypothetical protein
MEGRKLEEGDWTDAYCDARGIPKAGWSNLDIDVTYENVGLEQKMLRFDRGDSIATACGKWLMHPSLTRSIRVDQSMEANEAMVSVLGQYSALLDARRAKVESRYQGDKQIELRTGWLLWRSDLTEYLYFEESANAPDTSVLTAEWVKNEQTGQRKPSTNLWIYDRETGQKRYSVTTVAGAKIQPYFQVPTIDDPNLVHIDLRHDDAGNPVAWVKKKTAERLERLLGSGWTVTDLENAIALARASNGDAHEGVDLEHARQITLSAPSRDLLDLVAGPTDDVRMDQVLDQLEEERSASNS